MTGATSLLLWVRGDPPMNPRGIRSSPGADPLCKLSGMRRSGAILILVLATSACSDDGSTSNGGSESSSGGHAGVTATSAGGSGPGGSGSGGSGQATSSGNGQGGGAQAASSSADESTATSGGTAGTGSGAPRGAVSLHVTPVGSCSLGDRWVDFPQVESGHPVDATAHGTLLEDFTRDENGWAVTVKCEWLAVEPPYYVSLGITLRSDTDQRFVTIAPGEVALGQPTTASMLVRDGEANPRIDVVDDTPCSVEILDFDFEGGTVWLSYSCPALTDSDGVESCQIVEGYAYFENCAPRE